MYAVTCGGEHDEGVMAVTRRVESLFKSSEHEMKVPYDPDVYAVTYCGEHGEGDGCDEEGGGAGQEGHHGPEVEASLQEQ